MGHWGYVTPIISQLWPYTSNWFSGAHFVPRMTVKNIVCNMPTVMSPKYAARHQNATVESGCCVVDFFLPGFLGIRVVLKWHGCGGVGEAMPICFGGCPYHLCVYISNEI